MTFFKGIEASIASTTDLAYAQIEFYWGKEMDLYRPDKTDVHTKVHNKEANSALQFLKKFVGVTQVDDLSTTDGYNQANFSEGFLITQLTDIRVGDVIEFIGGGGKVRYKVERRADLGYTSTMFFKFLLSSMN